MSFHMCRSAVNYMTLYNTYSGIIANYLAVVSPMGAMYCEYYTTFNLMYIARGRG